jgi:Protein of unknown function (DUF642)/PEP-CTERM motif
MAERITAIPRHDHSIDLDIRIDPEDPLAWRLAAIQDRRRGLRAPYTPAFRGFDEPLFQEKFSMRTRIIGLLCFGMMAALATDANANFVVNGTFASPPEAASFGTFPAGSTAITGWTVVNGVNTPSGGSVDLLGTFLTPPPGGGQTVDLDGTASTPGGPAAGGLEQTITGLTIGTSYTLSFYYSNNYQTGGITPSAMVSIGGLSTDISHDSSTGPSNPNYTFFSSTFIATGSSDLLSFLSLDPAADQFGIVIGNVQINPTVVPEPASIAMLGLGLLAVGGVSRLRRRAV